LGSKLKEGNFGVVYKARWTLDEGEEPKIVAAKTLKRIDTALQLENFLREGVMMRAFNHKNVLKIYGVCTAPGEYPIIVLPYMENGDLRGFLRDSENELTVIELICLCVDISSGMNHLAEKNFVHRDLAVRNVFVGGIDESTGRHNLKVGDFGLSRDLHERDYYRSGQQTELPLKWMAPESIERSMYSEKSDVWSFGITIWEVMTRAITPYATVDAIYIIEYLKSNKRLEKPSSCPDKLYDIMKHCWKWNPDHRPVFGTILRQVMNIYNERKSQLEQQNRIAANRNNRNEELSPLNQSFTSSRAPENDYAPEPK